MAYGVSNVVRDSTVGYPSNSFASCFYLIQSPQWAKLTACVNMNWATTESRQ